MMVRTAACPVLILLFVWLHAVRVELRRQQYCSFPIGHMRGLAASCLFVLAAEMDHLIGTLKDAGLCKDVHYKELYIPQAELEGANAASIDHMYKLCRTLPHGNGGLI